MKNYHFAIAISDESIINDIKSLGFSDVIWWHRSWSLLVRVRRAPSITLTSFEQSSIWSCGIRQGEISQEILKISTLDMSLKITNLWFITTPSPRGQCFNNIPNTQCNIILIRIIPDACRNRYFTYSGNSHIRTPNIRKPHHPDVFGWKRNFCTLFVLVCPEIRASVSKQQFICNNVFHIRKSSSDCILNGSRFIHQSMEYIVINNFHDSLS